MPITLDKINTLRNLSKRASDEMSTMDDAPSLVLFEDALFNNAEDLLDAAELSVTPLNLVANRFLDTVDQNKILKLKVKELEDKIQAMNDDAAGEDI